jgi:hypothetical protein
MINQTSREHSGALDRRLSGKGVRGELNWLIWARKSHGIFLDAASSGP